MTLLRHFKLERTTQNYVRYHTPLKNDRVGVLYLPKSILSLDACHGGIYKIDVIVGSEPAPHVCNCEYCTRTCR